MTAFGRSRSFALAILPDPPGPRLENPYVGGSIPHRATKDISYGYRARNSHLQCFAYGGLRQAERYLTYSKTRQPVLGNVETVKIHDLCLRSYKILYKLLAGVGGRIHLGDGA